MPDYNRVVLMGRLTKDPVPQTNQAGTSSCHFTLATDRTWKNKAGEKQTETLYVTISAYGKTAEALGRYMRKGSLVHVEGYLRLDRWTSQGGEQRQMVKVVAEDIQFLLRASNQIKTQEGAHSLKTPAASDPNREPDEDEELPF